MSFHPRLGYVALLILLGLCLVVRAQQPVSLMEPREAWKFDNGREFPGATGQLAVDTQAKEGSATFKLVGDFTKGGNYVQAGRNIDKIDIRELSLWVRNPDGARFTIRLNDATGQCHQLAIKLEPKGDWQKIVLPLENFFSRRGQADAVTSVAKYESWGGAKDGRWHGPATAVYLLLSNVEKQKEVRTLWFHDITLVPRPAPVTGAEVKTVIPLDEITEGEHDWRFSRGEEFKGAKGALTVAQDQPAKGQTCLKLAGDFTGGGGYVAAIKDLGELAAQDVTAFHLKVKSDTGAALRFQLKDGSGQTHQRPPLRIPGDGQWHDLEIKPVQHAGGEHWGGANDGEWHGPPVLMAISLSNVADLPSKEPVVYLANIRADALLPVFAQTAAFKSDFEGTEKLPDSWTVKGSVAIDNKMAFKGRQSLRLARTLDNVEQPCAATGPSFPAAPGMWQIDLASRAELLSPDNSYHAVVSLECLDRGGKVIERITLADLFGKRDWQKVQKRIELPKGVASARFHAQLDKTYGRFWVDELAASYLAPAPRRDDRIARLLFSTAQLGNLLFPDDLRQVSVTVEATKPLRDSQQTLAYEVRDYWGAEQMKPATVSLQRTGKKGNRIQYQASIDLSKVPLEIGRYYELHATIAQEGTEPFRNFTSLAILPEADNKRLSPQEVPFTSRNWDNRITEYFLLSDRLGLRTCGIWGGWSAKPPYKPEAPGLDLCKKLGMGVLSGTPIHSIELGKKDYDEQALRQGARNFVEKFGKYRPLTVNLGNEPHGKGDKVRANVAAYQTVYEEIKKADPDIYVVATSVEPNEEYFQLGYGKWCDAYDFHVYEGFEHVRKNIEQYQALMKKYGPVKPLWSTELGLNSQGLPRHVVAVELFKTFTTFFAAGGVNASWFGLLYPDPEGKSYGSSGDALNVFDCRFNRYAPRLDAIAYYHAVNAIGNKKFVEEKKYPGGISAFLFQNKAGVTLQVLWKDKGRQDVLIPLAGVKQVQVIRTDGTRHMLNALGKGITLSVSEDPLLLIYEGGEKTLAHALETPAASLVSPPKNVARNGSTMLAVVVHEPSAGNLELIAPPFWTVQKTSGETGQPSTRFTLTAPPASSVRELDLVISIGDPQGNRNGELYFRAPVAE